MKKILSIIALGLIITVKAMAYEEANYETIKTNKVYEIRQYSHRLAIETSNSNQNNIAHQTIEDRGSLILR